MTARPPAVVPALSRWAVDSLRRAKLAAMDRPVPLQELSPVTSEAELLLARHLSPALVPAVRELLTGPGVPTTRAELVRFLRAATRPVMEDAVPFSRLRQRVLEASAAHRVVGFDLFNTVMVRSVEGEWIKTAVAWWLAQRLAEVVDARVSPTAQQVRARRSELEAEVAAERVAQGYDNEVDYEEMLSRWVGTWITAGPARDHFVALTRDWELNVERLALRPAPGIRALLQSLHARGQRIIFVSDMYLRSEVLQSLLDHCGVGRFFAKGYASVDFGLRKATGRLFGRVLEAEGIAPGDLLFVGDDPLADRDQPRRLGIRTLNVEDPDERARRFRLEVAEQAVTRNPAASALLAHEILHAQLPSAGDDLDYHAGLMLAPGLVGFVLDVVERARAQRLDALYFLAREGLTFLKILTRLQRSGVIGKLPPVRYLFVSRASTILPSMRSLSWDELQRFWRQYSRQSLRRLLKNLSLPESELLPLGAAAGLVDPDHPILAPEEDPAFQRFLGSRAVQAAFLRHRDAARARLRSYLSRSGFFDAGRVGLVDIGWKGSMQNNLLHAFGNDPALPELHGFYVGLLDDGTNPHPRSHKYGYLADTRRGVPEEIDFFRNSSIFEMVTTVNHGSTVGYAPHPHAPGLTTPVLLQHDVERENSARYFNRAQQAIFDYAEVYARLHPLLAFDAAALQPGLLADLMRYTRYPTEAEARRFAEYSHVESFGVHEVTRFGLGVGPREFLKLKRPWRMWRELRRRFEQNPWREAVVARGGSPWATALYDGIRTLGDAR